MFASLLHDIGKAVSVPNHPEIAAAIIKPYVRPDVYNVIRAHQDFQGRHYYHHFGGDPDARDQYEGEPWFDLAAQFADEWDQIAFDPDYDTLPLEHFEPLVRARCAKAIDDWSDGVVSGGVVVPCGSPAVLAVARRGSCWRSDTGRWSIGMPVAREHDRLRLAGLAGYAGVLGVAAAVDARRGSRPWDRRRHLDRGPRPWPRPPALR